VFAALLAFLVLGAEGGARLLSPFVPRPLAWPDLSTELKAEQLREVDCAEVVVAGNSMARDGIVPQLLGAPTAAYNASLDAATPELLGAWLSEVVVPELEPSVVVLALATMDLNENSAAGDAAARAYAESLEGRRDLTGRASSWLAARSALVRYRTELRSPETLGDSLRRAVEGERLERSPEDELSGVIGPLGEGLSRRDLTHSGTSALTELIRTEFLADFEIARSQVDATRRLVDDLRERGHEVVLVTLPVTDDFVELHPDGTADVEDFRAAIGSIATDTGALWVDYLDRDFPTDQFADTHHLNAEGSTALTNDLRAELPEVDDRCAT
jgi:hypothetical protein